MGRFTEVKMKGERGTSSLLTRVCHTFRTHKHMYIFRSLITLLHLLIWFSHLLRINRSSLCLYSVSHALYLFMWRLFSFLWPKLRVGIGSWYFWVINAVNCGQRVITATRSIIMRVPTFRAAFVGSILLLSFNVSVLSRSHSFIHSFIHSPTLSHYHSYCYSYLLWLAAAKLLARRAEELWFSKDLGATWTKIFGSILSYNVQWSPFPEDHPDVYHSHQEKFTHWFIDSLIHSLIHWFINSLIHWFIDSLIHWFINSLIHWFIDSFIHSFNHSLTYFLTFILANLCSSLWTQ
jgi:hypothetical protein